jgi:hypothetical protein
VHVHRVHEVVVRTDEAQLDRLAHLHAEGLGLRTPISLSRARRLLAVAAWLLGAAYFVLTRHFDPM